jgi:hypothetical protein
MKIASRLFPVSFPVKIDKNPETYPKSIKREVVTPPISLMPDLVHLILQQTGRGGATKNS